MPGLRTRLATIAIISLFLVSLNPGSPLLPIIPRVHAATTIWLRATYPTWNNTNPPITVTSGDSITMQLSNPDTFMHRFVVDVDNSPPTSAPNCSVEKCSPFFSSPITYPFLVDFPSGPYKYYCSVHFNVMVGTFTVQTPVPDFTISASAATPASFVAGNSATSTITLTSLNSFAGSVNLATSTTSPVTGLTFSFSQNPVPLTAGGTGTSTLTISTTASTPAGTYTITVTGTGMGGAPSHSATTAVTVVGPDFSISPTPTGLTILQGSSGTSTVTLASLNGFTGSVTLSVAVSPAGPTASINPPSVSLSSGGTGTATLTVSTSTGAYSSTATGSYTITVTGTSGSLSHPATVSATVTSSNPSPLGIGNIPASVLLGIIAAAVAVAVIAVVLVRRRPKT